MFVASVMLSVAIKPIMLCRNRDYYAERHNVASCWASWHHHKYLNFEVELVELVEDYPRDEEVNNERFFPGPAADDAILTSLV